MISLYYTIAKHLFESYHIQSSSVRARYDKGTRGGGRQCNFLFWARRENERRLHRTLTVFENCCQRKTIQSQRENATKFAHFPTQAGLAVEMVLNRAVWWKYRDIQQAGSSLKVGEKRLQRSLSIAGSSAIDQVSEKNLWLAISVLSSSTAADYDQGTTILKLNEGQKDSVETFSLDRRSHVDVCNLPAERELLSAFP